MPLPLPVASVVPLALPVGGPGLLEIPQELAKAVLRVGALPLAVSA
jgi:hypothetical protein